MTRRPAGPEERAALFAGARRWYRLEQLPAYKVPGETEALAAFTAGQAVPDEFTGVWAGQVRTARDAGRELTRIRVVPRKLTTYLRFEMRCYQASVDAGENILILDAGDAPDELPGQDFWLLDDRVLWMVYDAEGRFLGCELDEDPAVAGRLLEVLEIAAAVAVPYADYIRQDLAAAS